MGWTQTSECPMGVDVAQRKKEKGKRKKKNHFLFDAAFPLGRQSMSPSLGLRRVSQSFNTLLRHRSLAHRPFTTKSPTGRVLFLAHSTPPMEQCFYSAKIQKDGTLGPATHTVLHTLCFAHSLRKILHLYFSCSLEGTLSLVFPLSLHSLEEALFFLQVVLFYLCWDDLQGMEAWLFIASRCPTSSFN
jgi:hypothetical protein